MDIETRLHGRRTYRRKCDLHQAGDCVGGNDPLQTSCSCSEPHARHVRLTGHLPPLALAFCEPHVSGRKTSWIGMIQIVLIAILAIIESATAASVNFENCMSPNVINSIPLQLQFIPLFVNATFNLSAASHNLNFTVYGNVTGRTHSDPLPGPTDPHWQNSSETEGKIPDYSLDNNKLTTLKSTFDVLDYTPYNSDRSEFCASTVHVQCPLAPSFNFTG